MEEASVIASLFSSVAKVVTIVFGLSSAPLEEPGIVVIFRAGGIDFAPEQQVFVQENMRTMSTPAFSLQLTPTDSRRFYTFTQAHIGELMELRVCSEVVMTPRLQTAIPDGQISIHNAPPDSRLAKFLTEGCP